MLALAWPYNTMKYHAIQYVLFFILFTHMMLAIAWPEGTSPSVIYQPGSQSRALVFDSFEIGSISHGIFREVEF